jgi:hypothetical protein
MTAQPALPGLADGPHAVEWRHRKPGQVTPWRRWAGDLGTDRHDALAAKLILLRGVWPGREFRVVPAGEGSS